LRFRLRAAALILLVGFGAFLVRHVAAMFAGEPLDSLLFASHILAVVVLAVCSLPLCGRHSVSRAKLRVAELLIFGVAALFFPLLQHRVTLAA
jgi:hypothetical protein